MAVLRNVSLAAAFALAATSALAQNSADRVWPASSGPPLTLAWLDGQVMAMLGDAAGVPTDFESAGRPVHVSGFHPNGKTVAQVLDALTAADPRYAWHDDNGVITVYPRKRSPGHDVLNAPIKGAIKLTDVDPRDVFAVVGRLFSGREGSNPPKDTKRFSFEVAEGSTIRDLLNTIVRTHGRLSWAFSSDVSPTVEASGVLYLQAGTTAEGIFIRKDGAVNALTTDFTVSRRHASDVPALDRVVQSGREITASQITAGLAEILAVATGVPIGIETYAADELPINLELLERVKLNGLSLRTALTTLTILDPRYEWRELDGVIVLRPVRAWTDPDDPLFQPLAGTRLIEVTADRAIAALLPHLGLHTGRTSMGIGDSRSISIDLPTGTVLDYLNAVARSHGELTWHWQELSEEEQQEWRPTPARRMLHVTVFGTGKQGWPIP